MVTPPPSRSYAHNRLCGHFSRLGWSRFRDARRNPESAKDSVRYQFFGRGIASASNKEAIERPICCDGFSTKKWKSGATKKDNPTPITTATNALVRVLSK
jgi:hypothetical protein